MGGGGEEDEDVVGVRERGKWGGVGGEGGGRRKRWSRERGRKQVG